MRVVREPTPVAVPCTYTVGLVAVFVPIVTVLWFIPRWSGLNSICSSQLLPAPIPSPQLFPVMTVPGPLLDGRTARVPVPIFVTVRVLVALPGYASEPKFRLEGETLAIAVALAPVPERISDWVASVTFPEFSVSVSSVVSSPEDPGVKSKLRLQIAPAVSDNVPAVQSGTGPDPGTTVKLVSSSRLPVPFSVALPTF